MCIQSEVGVGKGGNPRMGGEGVRGFRGFRGYLVKMGRLTEPPHRVDVPTADYSLPTASASTERSGKEIIIGLPPDVTVLATR